MCWWITCGTGGEAVAYLEAHAESLLVSAMTVGELYAGVREGAERRRLVEFLAAMEIIPVDAAIAPKRGPLPPGLRPQPRRRPGRRAHRRHCGIAPGEISHFKCPAFSDDGGGSALCKITVGANLVFAPRMRLHKTLCRLTGTISPKRPNTRSAPTYHEQLNNTYD
jgi:hypothetical protein